MTTTEIMMKELNHDLAMVKIWREKQRNSETEAEHIFYNGCLIRSRSKAEAKEELIQSLGYTVLFSDDRGECIALYPMELDD